jgi:hypothetical protein
LQLRRQIFRLDEFRRTGHERPFNGVLPFANVVGPMLAASIRRAEPSLIDSDDRIFEIDVLKCPDCNGRLRILAAMPPMFLQNCHPSVSTLKAKPRLNRVKAYSLKRR